MKRFTLFCIVTLGLWLTPVACLAQERLIAVVMADSTPRYQDIHSVFVANSEAFCGTDCRIYVQSPHADVMSLRNSVRKAVALGADLIVTYGSAATLAAQAESPPVPVVFADVYDPVKLKLISEKSRTGRNMTGVRGDAPVQALFNYFTDATKTKKLAVLYDQGSPESNLQKTTLEESGRKRGITIVPLGVIDTQEHLAALEAIPVDTDGVFLASSEHSEKVLSLCLQYASEHKLPVMTQRSGAAQMGALMVLETSHVEQGERLASLAEKILAGEKPGDITVQTPRLVEFVVNLKVAKEYGINIPFQTLSVASRVVR